MLKTKYPTHACVPYRACPFSPACIHRVRVRGGTSALGLIHACMLGRNDLLITLPCVQVPDLSVQGGIARSNHPVVVMLRWQERVHSPNDIGTPVVSGVLQHNCGRQKLSSSF